MSELGSDPRATGFEFGSVQKQKNSMVRASQMLILVLGFSFFAFFAFFRFVCFFCFFRFFCFFCRFFLLDVGVIYLFNLLTTVPSYFGYLKKISPQAPTALPRRAASGSELPHVLKFRLFAARVYSSGALSGGGCGAYGA